MRDFFCLSFALAIALVGSVDRLLAGDGCCAHCGCTAACQKVCRLECIEKKVEITCYGCKCEDFCLPGHSQRGCQHCDVVCDACAENWSPDAPYAKPKDFVWSEWIPGCARVHTKKKLMKKTFTKKVPSYKWVVEDLCSQCESKAAAAVVPPDAAIPLPPATDARITYGHIEATVPPIVTLSDAKPR